MCVGDFFAFGEDSFFLPVAFAAGSTRPLRNINYIFQRWMQFRNKNPLNMSDSLQVNSPSLESNIFARASPPTYFKRQWIYERLYLHTITDNYIYA